KLYQLLGDNLRKNGDLREAEVALREALHLDPGFSPAQKGLLDVLRQQNKLAEIVAYRRDQCQRDPNDGQAHSDLGLALLRRAEVAQETPPWDEAAGEFVKAIDLLADKYHSGRSDVCRFVNNWDEIAARVHRVRLGDPGLAVGRAEYLARRAR